MKFAHALALVAVLGSTPLQAVDDTGLVLHDTGIGKRATGVGVVAGIKIKLGPDSVVDRSERVKLGIAAGPTLVLPNARTGGTTQRILPSAVSFDLRPGYSAKMNVAGQEVVAKYTQLGAAEKAKDGEEDGDDDKQSTGDKIAWVAAVAGGVMLVGVGVVAILISEADCCE